MEVTGIENLAGAQLGEAGNRVGYDRTWKGAPVEGSRACILSGNPACPGDG